MSVSCNIIVARFSPGMELADFLVYFIYGPSTWHARQPFWILLQSLVDDFPEPSLFIGDFNELLSNSEKRGGCPARVSSSRGFSHFLESNGLVDLGFDGPMFTWCNGPFRPCPYP